MKWLTIKDYPNYSVSDCGDVIGKRGKKLKPQVLRNGYLVVNLYNHNGMKAHTIHRLVANHFINNPDNLPQVNHINEDKSDNNVSNLSWCTTQFNVEYSQSRRITLKNPSGEVVNIFNVIKFCRENNLSAYGIRCVLSGKHKQHKGWTRYDN